MLKHHLPRVEWLVTDITWIVHWVNHQVPVLGFYVGAQSILAPLLIHLVTTGALVAWCTVLQHHPQHQLLRTVIGTDHNG